MKTSDEGIAFLASHEGLVIAPYLDIVGVWTWGVGHTAAAGKPIPAHMDMKPPADVDGAISETLRVFRDDLARYEQDVRDVLTVEVSQHEFDAMVSFHFNTGGIKKATWVKQLNAGNRSKAIKSIMNWLRPPQIKKRRTAERNLFAHGDYGGTKTAVYTTDGSGRLNMTPIMILSAWDVVQGLRKPTPDPTPQIDAQPPKWDWLAPLVAFFKGWRKKS